MWLKIESLFIVVRACPGSRNIRHSRNIPSIVCCTCCDCCGLFSVGKIAFPRLLKVATVGTFRVLIGDCVETRRESFSAIGALFFVRYCERAGARSETDTQGKHEDVVHGELILYHSTRTRACARRSLGFPKNWDCANAVTPLAGAARPKPDYNEANNFAGTSKLVRD